MLRLATACLCLVSACFFDEADPGTDDIVGPFTGARTRYVVDGLIVPMNSIEARTYGSDLNGDRTVDNQLGQVIGVLIGSGTADEHAADRIAGGELQMVVEIQADDLTNDDRAGVWVHGFGDTEVRPTGGAFVDGAFIPNFIRDAALEHTGSATLPLPLLAHADTSRMEVPYMQLSLVPDGAGGYDAQIHGVVRGGLDLARLGVDQQLAEQPEQHRWMWSVLDTNHDGTITDAEWQGNGLFASLLAPDITFAGEKLLSFGMGFHLIPCAAGNCALSTTVDRCFDRVRDGDEVDVDCGGECGPCGVEMACVTGSDCQSGTCAEGVCTAPTCFDGIKNGYEASTDCGGACAKNCELGQVCGMDLDCEFACSVTYSDGTGVCTRFQ